jgi:subtilisin family serine protease
VRYGIAFALLSLLAAPSVGAPGPAHHPRRLILELAPGTPRPGLGTSQLPGVASRRLASSGMAALDAVHARHEPVVYEPMFPSARTTAPGAGEEDLTRFYTIELPEGASLGSALADYTAVPGVRSAEAVPLAALSYVPNDPRVPDQWQLGQPSDCDSDVFEAWDILRGDTSVVIAILDTGVLYSHDDLGGPAPHTFGTIAHNWIEMAGAPGVDDDANGFVDDFRGWDFVANGSGVAGEDVSFADNDPIDFAGHGTFVAGVAGARTDNGVGIAGTAFGAKILPCRVGYKDAASSPGQIDIGYAAQAIVYAADRGVQVINCSWESFGTQALASALNYAIGRDVTVVDAAGNDNSPWFTDNYLASRGDCIDVAAVTRSDIRTGFSNYGAWIDVSAAGSSVTSTWGGTSIAGYLTSGGTSVAAPFVSGAVALYQAYRRSLGLPFATPAEIRQRVFDAGDDIDALNPGYAGMLGRRLNVHRLLSDPLVGVPAGSSRIPSFSFTAAPNPSAAPVHFRLRRPVESARDGDGVVRIHSVAGRLVRTLPIPSGARSGVDLTWDGTDDRGNAVAAGIYFARARWGRSEADLRLVRLR